MFKMFISNTIPCLVCKAIQCSKKVATLASYPWLVNDAINRHFHVFFNFLHGQVREYPSTPL